MSAYACRATTHPGVERILAGELAALGLAVGEVGEGGVAFEAEAYGVYAANIWARTAGRVVVRLATFTARGFPELERKAARAPWADFVAPGSPVRFRVTSKRSKLYHEGAIEERLRGVAVREAGASPEISGLPEQGAPADGVGEGGAVEDGAAEGGAVDPLFVVRVDRDRVTLSADASGELLHRRGYRVRGAKAPLRETLAAALLISSGWDGASPLVDPFCGSGTIAIEAALMARRIPPGWRRAFAFERWPSFDAGAWEEVRAWAGAGMLAVAPATIVGSDRDAGAVETSRANAERAGVAANVTFVRRAVSALEPPGTPGMPSPPGTPSEGSASPVRGWLVTNPPYGRRLGDPRALRDLYAAFGNVVRARLSGWRVAMISADRALEGQVGLRFRERLRTDNGGVRVRFVEAEVGGG